MLHYYLVAGNVMAALLVYFQSSVIYPYFHIRQEAYLIVFPLTLQFPYEDH
jgi:hypothetical protein